MADITQPLPFEAALRRLRGQREMPVAVGTRRIGELDAAIRERAFFSARVLHTGFLERAKDLVEKITSPTAARAAGEPVTMDRAKARLDLKRYLGAIGYDPTAEGVIPGSLQDLSSDGRLNLILDTNKQMARGYGNFVADQDEDILAAFPAAELVRLEDREEPRDWIGRWVGAGGNLYDGRMVAPKNDPIWEAISEFGLPYPPFDFNSGMGVVDVGYREAVALGVIQRGQKIEPVRRDLTDDVEAAIPEDPALVRALAGAFSDRIEIVGDRMRLKGAAA